MILRVLSIPIGGKGTDKLSVLLLYLEGATDFAGNISGVLLIDHVFNREANVIGALLTVDGVPQSDKANAPFRKPSLQIVAHINVVPAKPGKVFNHNTVDFPGFNIQNHPLKIRAVKIIASVSIVRIEVDQFHLGLSSKKPL